MNNCYLHPQVNGIFERFPAFKDTLWSGIWRVSRDRDRVKDPVFMSDILEFLLYKLFI